MTRNIRLLSGTLASCWIVFYTLLLCLTGTISAQETVQPIRVMSFNIRYGTANDGDNHWDHRKMNVAETINIFKPDVIGVQETLDFQAEFLQQQLSGYHYIGRSRTKDATGGEQCGIFFRSDRFDKLAAGHFWLSETPDKPGSKSWDSSLPRMATWLKIWDRKNNRSLYVINTHFDHRGRIARVKSAELIRKFISGLKSTDEAILTGDFNVPENSEPYKALFTEQKLKRNLLDSFRMAHPQRQPNEGTAHGFRGSDKGSRIDWIAVTDGFEIESAEIVKTEYDGKYPSDHFPVTAVVKPNSKPASNSK